MYEYDDEDISDVMDIVELQIENDKLNKEIKRLNERIEDLNIINEEHNILNKMIRKELKKVKKERIEQIDRWLDIEYGVSYTKLKKLYDFVIEQENKQIKKIDKAVEYINNLECLHIGIGENEYNLNEMYGSTKDYVKDLLEILKGGKNNE